MSNNTVTRAAALAAAVEAMVAYGCDPAAVAVVERILAQVSKPAPKSTAPSKAARENIVLAEQLRDLLEAKAERDGEPTPENPAAGCMHSTQIRDEIAAIMTTQKAIKVAGVAIEQGWVERVKVGSKVMFKAAA